MRTREPRRNVLLKARMRQDRSWTDVTIRNVSARGMLLCSEDPPERGAYIEICGPAATLVGRVAWVRNGYFGVRTQDRIDVDSALSGGKWRQVDPPPREANPAELRRPLAITAALARHRANGYQYATALFSVLAVATIIGLAVHGLLSQPFDAVAATLAGR